MTGPDAKTQVNRVVDSTGNKKDHYCVQHFGRIPVFVRYDRRCKVEEVYRSQVQLPLVRTNRRLQTETYMLEVCALLINL